MSIKTTITAFLLLISIVTTGQTETEINKTDPQGRKQGHWIKKYPNQSIMYDGYFKDNHPTGEFKRYDEYQTLESILIFDDNGTDAAATTYHPNGYIASKGKYINQMKEGKWQFFSISVNGYMICEEYYSKNKRNGQSVKFYPDSTVGERVTYSDDIKQGEWIKYYPSGVICLRSSYQDGKINGKFEVWYENGQIEFSGQYKNDLRDGLWYIYNEDGTTKYKLEYKDGITTDRQMDIDASDYLDSLDRNKGKVADPEKTGAMW
ncbi:MAG TPA: toxin-antitoxin system YwqK family antitoxin [Bacteroidales bacterium]|nr:toxin-antitoxin system YwqK family antitoxin [Bacteroidales bacterium]